MLICHIANNHCHWSFLKSVKKVKEIKTISDIFIFRQFFQISLLDKTVIYKISLQKEQKTPIIHPLKIYCVTNDLSMYILIIHTIK